MRETFSSRLKLSAEQTEVKKKCCRFTDSAFTFPGAVLSKKQDSYDTISAIWEKCRCDGCRQVFFRRMFIIFGSVTDPMKSYHLDFAFSTVKEAELMAELLSENGFGFSISERSGRHIVYVKNSGAIEDFLVFIGAQPAAFEVMNSKIVHEIRNDTNRQVNCDTANIGKQLEAARTYIDAIRYLLDTGKLDSLPEDLRITAKLRIENEQLSLTELGRMMNPEVSKSGVRHRLKRILAAAQNAAAKEGK